MTALEFARLVKNAKRRADGEWWDSVCPGHADRRASLSFTDGDVALVVQCHAGCTRERIAAGVGRTVADFSHHANGAAGDVTTTQYEIRDSAGALVAIHVRQNRADGKHMWWKRPDGSRGLGGRKVADLPLYGVEALTSAPDALIIVTEGEKARDALVTRGFLAVATVTGAGVVPSDESLRPLLARPAALWADADAPGRGHMDGIAARLARLRHRDVRRIAWPDARGADDAFDFFARGGTVEECHAMIASAAPFANTSAPVPTNDDAPGAGALAEPELHREGLDLALVWPDGARFLLSAIRDGREGVRGELAVTQDSRRLSWGAFALSSTQAREALRKKLEAVAPGPPWGEYLEETAFRLTHAAREGEPIVTLTGAVTSPTRELLPRLLYEGEPTLLYADGDTGKSLVALTVAAAVQSGAALPFGLKPARAVPTAFLDWETSRDTIEARLALVSAGLGIDPPGILYKRMTRPLADEAAALGADFVRRGVGLIVIDSMMFAVAGGDGAAFHEPITGFYNALRLFAPAASLVLSHVTGADARGGGPARPFGGAFAFNGPRLIWEAKRDPDITDATAIAFTCRKANNLPRKPEPFGLRFVPGDGTITVYPLDLTETSPTVVAGASLPYRVRLALAQQDMTTPEIAETLGVKDNVARAVLARLKKKGEVVERGTESRTTRWGLAPS